jgi:hypothetical protein
MEPGFAGRDSILSTAVRAFDAVRPKPTLKIFAGGFLVGEHLEKLKGADGYVIVHGSKILNYPASAR